MKLVLGIPSAGSPAAPFLQSLQTLRLPARFTALQNKTVTGNFVPAARELLAEYALENGADYLLMADDDMVIPPDSLNMLMEPFAQDDVALTGALYYSRDGLRPMAVDDWNPDDTTSAAIPAFDQQSAVSVGGVGFGLVLIRMSVLARMERPFFATQVYIERAAARVRICNEDYLFCHRLRALGHRVMLHSGVRCGHYDRQSDRTFPSNWESPEITNQRRMMVRKPDGNVGMAPFEGAAPRTGERHVSARLDYIVVD